MVLRHFRLREQPFGVTPDPRFLFASGTHREALASILYGVQSGLGFITLTANPGMGKTTLLFEALRRMQKTMKTVFLFQAIASPIDLVRALLIDLGATDTSGTQVELQTQLNEALVNQAATGKRLVVVIDEAQNLDDSVLEAVRMLSNFETASHKLMHIILSGQLQLADKLAQPRLLQLRQRISIFAHLERLSTAETISYIEHRLRVAGHDSDNAIFTTSALALIARESEGIPRNINNICFNALTLGCALQRKTIDVDNIREVLEDLNFGSEAAQNDGVAQSAERSWEAAPSRIVRRRMRLNVRKLLLPAAICAIGLIFAWLIVLDYRALTADATVAANTSEAAPAAVEQAPTRTVAPGTNAAVTSTPAPAAGDALTPAKTPADAPASVSATTLSIKPRDIGADTLATTATPAPVNQVDTPIASSPETHPTRTVSVRSGQSLYAICAKAYGTCTPEFMKEIIRINPKISNPDRVVSGQKIALPVFDQSSGDSK